MIQLLGLWSILKPEFQIQILLKVVMLAVVVDSSYAMLRLPSQDMLLLTYNKYSDVKGVRSRWETRDKRWLTWTFWSNLPKQRREESPNSRLKVELWFCDVADTSTICQPYKEPSNVTYAFQLNLRLFHNLKKWNRNADWTSHGHCSLC